MGTILPASMGLHEVLRTTKIPWVKAALDELDRGVKEIPGPGSNPRIEAYHAVTAAGAAPDGIAWCASFVCFCLQRAGQRHTSSKASKSYRTYGVAHPIGLGSIGVIQNPIRRNRGHVGIVVGYDERWRVVLLGGNQADSVCLRAYPFRKFKTFRMPHLWIPEPMPLLIPSGVGGSTR